MVMFMKSAPQHLFALMALPITIGLYTACDSALEYHSDDQTTNIHQAVERRESDTGYAAEGSMIEGSQTESRTGLPIENGSGDRRAAVTGTHDEPSPSCYNETSLETPQSPLLPSARPDERARYLDERETAAALALENWDDAWGDRETILRDLQRADDRRWRADGHMSGNRAESIRDDEMNGEESHEELARSERKLRELAAVQAVSERQEMTLSEELP
jgi:hypothetical protein